MIPLHLRLASSVSFFDRLFKKGDVTASSDVHSDMLPHSTSLPDSIRIVVGLGNPGPEYVGTRHNIGFHLVEQVADDHGLDWKRERKFRSKVARRGTDLILAKPLTFMNLSGLSVARLARFFKVKPEQVLVVYDDVDLPIGRLRFRASGSAGGHNGVKSVIQSLGGDKFPRLKIGVGASGGREEMISHVLGHFGEEEREDIRKSLELAADGVNCALSQGLNAAMNRFNQREKPKKKKAEKPSEDSDENNTDQDN